MGSEESRRGGQRTIGGRSRHVRFLHLFCRIHRDTNATQPRERGEEEQRREGGREGIRTHRQAPDAQSHLGVFLHEHPPEHVGHGDADDEDRRRGRE